MNTPIPWYQSHTFTALWQTTVLTSLIWLGAAVATNVWDWRNGLIVPLISNVIVLFKSMFDPTVAGIFKFQNARNVQP